MRTPTASGPWVIWLTATVLIVGERSVYADPGESITELVAITLFGATGAVIVARQPRHLLGWSWIGLTAWYAIVGIGATYAGMSIGRATPLPAASLAAVPFMATWLAYFTVLLVHTPLLFPDGLPPGRFWRVIYRASWINVGVGMVAGALWPGLLRDQDIPLDNPLGIPAVSGLAEGTVLATYGIVLVLALLAMGSLAVRYRRSDSVVRHQLKWFAYAVVVLAVFNVFYLGLLGRVLGEPAFGEAAFGEAAFGVAIGLLPIAIGIAILKYRLYDIDVVISKTVVFAGLAGFITAIYVGIVVGVGSLLGAGGEPNLALSIIATAVVAVAFQPVRELLTRLANRLVFGRRATPYEVLSRLSEHLGETAATETTLERMARLLADGTGAARAQVWLYVAGELRPTVTWPTHATDASEPEHLVDVRHEGELLGALSVDKQRGEALTPADVKLVDDLAAQAGLVLRNVRLTEELKAKIVELRASRQRLVAAQDAERRRLERDLHDGAQQQLVALKLKLGLARTTAEREQATQAAGLLGQLSGDADDAVATLRELAHGIYPPLLAAEGLPAALATQARRAAVPVVVEADGVGRYGADVEAAVYFCVLEAVNNAAKYAEPSLVTVRLSQANGRLTFTVADDGAGFDPVATPRGHGTTNMADRLDALGGELEVVSTPGRGTAVRGSLGLLAEAVAL